MIHAITFLAILSAPSPNPEAVSSPLIDVPEARMVPESVWAALVDHRVEVRSSTGEIVWGKLLSHDRDNVVLADDEGGVFAHAKATIVAVRIDEPTSNREPSADDVGPQSEPTRHGPAEHTEETSAASAPECRVDGECGNDGVCRLGACIASEPRPDRVAGRRLEWAGIGVLAGGVATAAGIGTWLWTSGYRSYQGARQDYYGSNGTCNTTWDPCGSRSDYRAAKRAADMRITAGIAVVAAGTSLVISGIAMAIVGGVRSKRSQRRHAALNPSWEQGALAPQWTVRF